LGKDFKRARPTRLKQGKTQAGGFTMQEFHVQSSAKASVSV